MHWHTQVLKSLKLGNCVGLLLSFAHRLHPAARLSLAHCFNAIRYVPFFECPFATQRDRDGFARILRTFPFNNFGSAIGWHPHCIAGGSAGTRLADSTAFNEVSDSMPKRRQLEEPQEPIGIVISRGVQEEPTPKLTAYVYSIEDETSGEPIDTRAA